jgi:FkbM family methyltransferase
LKKILKRVARSFGAELTRYIPSKSSEAQLAKALELCGANLIFDIGANEGQFAKMVRVNGYKGKIVSFEPLSSARKQLSVFASNDPGWQLHERSAIGDQDGEIKIHVAGNSVSSSVLPMLKAHSGAAVGSAYIGAEKVPIARLDSVAGQYLGFGSRLFVKIDTQGFEWQVLDGANETLNQVCGLLCELSLVPLYEGQRLWREVVDRLDAEGFMLWALQKGFTDPRTGQSLQMDGIFLRRDLLKE